MADHYEELGLAKYPWGLSKTISEERVERYNKELVIFQRLQKEKLLSENTNMWDVSVNNWIVDARKLYHKENNSDSRKTKVD